MSFRTKALGVGVTGVIAATALFLEPLEGLENYVYKDVAGVKTYCIGETQNPEEGRYYTDEECRALLMSRLPDYYKPIKAALKVDVPMQMEVALTSAAYNLGPQTVINSTPFRMINDGFLEAGCYSLILYKYAGGKDCSKRPNRCSGLINRRVKEIRKCVESLEK